MAYLDKTGLTYLWSKMKNIFATKEEAEDVFLVTCDLILAETSTATNFSHTYNEMLEAHNSGKIVRLKVDMPDEFGGYNYIMSLVAIADGMLGFSCDIGVIINISILSDGTTEVGTTAYANVEVENRVYNLETALDGYSLRTASEGDTGLDGYITFIV